MPIVRCSDQKRQTLEEFYSEWAASDDAISYDIGNTMLSVISRLNQMFLETQFYGLTSLARLVLFSQDSYKTDWYVMIGGRSYEYYIEYLLPKDQQPWEDAVVRGSAKSLDECMRYIIIAMVRSEGWKHSSELKRLYEEIKG